MEVAAPERLPFLLAASQCLLLVTHMHHLRFIAQPAVSVPLGLLLLWHCMRQVVSRVWISHHGLIPIFYLMAHCILGGLVVLHMGMGWASLFSIMLPEILRRLLLVSYSRSRPFDASMECLAFTSCEAAYNVGLLPYLLMRNQPILLEPSESLRITMVTLANSLLLQGLHVLRELHGTKAKAAHSRSGRAPMITNEEPNVTIRIAAWPWCAFGVDSRGQQRTRVKGGGSNAAGNGILAQCERSPDRCCLCMIACQTVVITSLIVLFLGTVHWRSHVLPIVGNFALLYETIALRRECGTRTSPDDSTSFLLTRHAARAQTVETS